MAELDYQMALLLQYKFEQEHKHKENTDSDLQLALELQEQFKQEEEVQRPKNNLVYKNTKANDSKCLVDPSWEVIDPTPDVHVLFITFNKRFFWDKLGSVTVSWSKRMTSCAGICSYQGRGGMCSITLSEPLLKLRPRKDLVETLLHEMIHAYLFVTHNNRDRDGHGPEFHKHMYRINGEAGTNISVYHDFHDEVRLYQQHWWRCDGPCQHQKPYFGTVRRATNRAPGPNDRWWEEHKRNCGGNFIKVKSPETTSKSNKSKKADKPKDPHSKMDIRNFIPAKPKSLEKSSPNFINKVHTITSNSGNQQVSNVIPTKTANIFGFTNLGTETSLKKPHGSNSGIKGAVKNSGSSTFVVTSKKTKNSTKTNDKSENSGKITKAPPVKIEAFNGSGQTLGTISTSLPNRNDYSIVRDHWLKKYEGNGQQSGSGVKRPFGSSTSLNNVSKIPKTNIVGTSTTPEKGSENLVECPVCQKLIRNDNLNSHLDTCLDNPLLNNKECLLCGVSVASENFDEHFRDCSAKSFEDDDDVILINSPKKVPETKSCPSCKIKLNETNYASHIESCLEKMFTEFNKKYGSDSNETSCLVCNKKIHKSQVDSHLDECNGMSNIFDTTNVFIEDNIDEPWNDKDNHDISYNCPFCLQLVEESAMEDHLGKCLRCEEKEKKEWVNSLCEVDSDFEDC